MMNRRDFLRATLVSAGAVMVGCSGDDPAGEQLAPGEKYFPQSVASGDPKPDSVILWTRVADDAGGSGDLALELQMATDDAFTQRVIVNGSESLAVSAAAAFDHCVKVKVKGLEAGKTYYYRFVYASGGVRYSSRTGRTKTAPAADADANVKFAFVSCQDFIGRYYNTYILLAQEELDFVVHLGDYVYETTGDPSFQVPDEKRKVSFTDTAGAIKFEGEAPYYAAKSLDNYRELYKTYRSDQHLQAVHEKFPMIVTWDDHEFSNDAHGATASYFSERVDELDVTRKKNANKAWFEYMPVDYADEAFVYSDAPEYPKDLTIYRDFTFGKNVHLVMTDLRSYRADHIVPEGAYPGSVMIEQSFLMAAGVPLESGRPYLNIDDAAYANHKKLLVDTAAAVEPDYDTSKITGNIAADYINSVIQATMAPVAPIDEAAQMTMERGFAYMHLGKSSLYGLFGSRYLVVKDTFDLFAAAKHAATKGESETVMGAEQEAWFLSTIQGSKATWKVWGNEYCLTPLQIDLTTLTVPEAFKQRFYMNVDAWDGFRNKRSELIEKLSAVGNVVAVTGDIHAFYASTPNVTGDISKRVVEFVGSSISSTTFRDELLSQIKSDPNLSSVPGVDLLAKSIDTIMADKINPHLAFAASDKHGFVVVEASGAEIVATYAMIAANVTNVDYTGDAAGVEAATKRMRFRAVAGENNLYQDFNGAWKRWDQETRTWV
ncbi:MAG TPA: alkaline phosphatase D family protein [Polyangiaceae bacterium]|nr:alkaline phosphatase D family protein [Polyangiaceae bacterium]